MNRLLIAAVLFCATSTFSIGCRSCQSCHDYDSPVANCNCNHCGTERAGSNMGSGGLVDYSVVEPETIEYSNAAQ